MNSQQPTYPQGITFSQIKDSQGNILHNGSGRIGDCLVFSGLPEMWSQQKNERLVDIDNAWFFDYNPHVIRGVKVEKTIPLIALADRSTHHTYLRNLPNFLSLPDKYCAYFGLECTLRHPRLYRYEDIERKPNKVIITTQGANQGLMMNETADRILSDEIIETIKLNYRNFEIVQIGLPTDKDAGVIDKRGIPIWDAVKEIAESMYYIGPNCGIMWIASAYPHITKKVILTQYNKNALQYLVPMHVDIHHHQWLDYSCQWYNKYIEDVGITSSFRKI